MKTKKIKIYSIMFLIMLMLVSSFIIGSSYAWFEILSTNNSSSFNTKTEGTDTIGIVFEQTDKINVTTAMPILDEDKEEYASKNKFTITIEEKLYNAQVAVEVNLVDINIDDELLSKDMKYELLINDEVVKNGTFLQISDSKLTLYPLTKLTNISESNGIFACELRIWLSETNESQNNMMNKKISGTIQIDSVVRR